MKCTIKLFFIIELRNLISWKLELILKLAKAISAATNKNKLIISLQDPQFPVSILFSFDKPNFLLVNLYNRGKLCRNLLFGIFCPILPTGEGRKLPTMRMFFFETNPNGSKILEKCEKSPKFMEFLFFSFQWTELQTGYYFERSYFFVTFVNIDNKLTMILMFFF